MRHNKFDIILKTVAHYLDYSIKNITGKKRNSKYVYARQLVSVVAFNHQYNLVFIGNKLNRHRTTIYYAIQQFEIQSQLYDNFKGQKDIKIIKRIMEKKNG